MNILNTTRTHGLDKFLDMIDDREDIGARKRGLITGERPFPPQLENFSNNFINSLKSY